jgi:hypothetical protein
VDHYNTLVQLRDLLVKHFSLEELRILCFNIEENYEDLPGDVITLKAQSLVERMSRTYRLDQLLEAARHQNPTAPWPTTEAIKSVTQNSNGEADQTFREKDLKALSKEEIVLYQAEWMKVREMSQKLLVGVIAFRSAVQIAKHSWQIQQRKNANAWRFKLTLDEATREWDVQVEEASNAWQDDIAFSAALANTRRGANKIFATLEDAWAHECNRLDKEVRNRCQPLILIREEYLVQELLNRLQPDSPDNIPAIIFEFDENGYETPEDIAVQTSKALKIIRQLSDDLKDNAQVLLIIAE